MVERKEEWWVPAADTRATASADIPPIKKPGGPRSFWAPRRVREVGAQFPDRQGRVSPSQVKLNTILPPTDRTDGRELPAVRKTSTPKEADVKTRRTLARPQLTAPWRPALPPPR